MGVFSKFHKFFDSKNRYTEGTSFSETSSDSLWKCEFKLDSPFSVVFNKKQKRIYLKHKSNNKKFMWSDEYKNKKLGIINADMLAAYLGEEVKYE